MKIVPRGATLAIKDFQTYSIRRWISDVKIKLSSKVASARPQV